MTAKRTAFLLSLAVFAYMAAFAALYVDRVWPVFQAIARALGS